MEKAREMSACREDVSLGVSLIIYIIRKKKVRCRQAHEKLEFKIGSCELCFFRGYLRDHSITPWRLKAMAPS